MSGALLGAAATALTVKGALAGPLGSAAEAPLNDAGKRVENAAQRAIASSSGLVDQAQPLLESAVARVPLQAQPNASQPSSSGNAASRLALLPPIRPEDPGHGQAQIRRILHDAALRHGIEPRLLLAVSYWESGWDQSRVSATGAIGILQVEPASAAEAGPALLGRTVDINDAYDNADVGAAILREDLDHFRDPAMALAAYYQGPASLEQNGMLPDTQQYVQGILDLAARISD